MYLHLCFHDFKDMTVTFMLYHADREVSGIKAHVTYGGIKYIFVTGVSVETDNLKKKKSINQSPR